MILLKGLPGSPYTRKMLSLLRYRRLPYRYLHARHGETEGLPQPKVNLIPVFYFRNDDAKLEAEVDSTRILRRLETEHAGRSVIPGNPVLRFLDYLLEDYADEWLTKAMFHYRWNFDADAKMAAGILPFWGDITAPDETITEKSEQFGQRQINRLYVVGSNETTAPIIEASYMRFLRLFTEHLERFPFLMGERPGASDFAVFGQLTQLAQFDPTSSRLALEQAPRVYSWVSLTEDLSGLEPEKQHWLEDTDVPRTLSALLQEMGRTYVPVMIANAAAWRTGESKVECIVDDKPWQQTTFAYQAHCVDWIRAEYDALDSTARSTIDALLAGSGCEALLTQRLE